MQAAPCDPYAYSGTTPGSQFYDLAFDDYNDGTGRTKIVTNNLGGQGPNNCCEAGPSYTCTPSPLPCTPDPQYIELKEIAQQVGGDSVSLRIYNTSVYKPADFGIKENKFQTQANNGPGFWQINLRPSFNEFTWEGATGSDEQPFLTDELHNLLDTPFFLDLFTTIFGTQGCGKYLFDARYTNAVSLFYSFVDPSGNPIVLDEFLITFFDFDQDYADGSRAFVRETVIVYDFVSMFVVGDPELEYVFSQESFALYPQISLLLGGVPVRTVTDFDSNNEPVYGTMEKHGAVVRSTREGVGPPQPVKYTWERCMGFCSDPRYTCSASRVPAPNRLDIYNTYCEQGQACGPNFNLQPSPLWTWTGCLWSNWFDATQVASGSGPDNLAGVPSSSYPAGQSVACELDCPRTVIPYDDGNPTGTLFLTAQQQRRSVSFLFRNTNNMTVIFRTDIGCEALTNINNDLVSRKPQHLSPNAKCPLISAP